MADSEEEMVCDAVQVVKLNVCESPISSRNCSCPSYVSGLSPPSYEEVMRDECKLIDGKKSNKSCASSFLTTEMEMSEDPRQQKPFRISDEEANEALKKFASKNCCFSRIPRNMTAADIKSYSAYKYVLQTFYEERSKSWKQEPYISQKIDVPGNGRPPSTWEIRIEPSKLFYDTEFQKEIPYTASINMCTECEGKGESDCTTCKGSGNVKCGACDGLGLIFRHNYHDDISGYDNHGASAPRHCVSCSGGRISCKQCFGKGKMECEPCLGTCRRKTFSMLTVKWRVLSAEQVFTYCGIPDRCVRNVTGFKLFEEQRPSVTPLSKFPYEDINQFSRKVILSHKDQLKRAKILMQRHHVVEIPIVEGSNEWKGKTFKYWVYGCERQVFCPDYPVKCSLM